MRRLATAHEAMRAAHPDEPHWYLQGIGTDPPARRQGLASALIRTITDTADRDELGCYLESTKPENVPLYEHHGFRITGTIDVADNGPTMWAMWQTPAHPALMAGITSAAKRSRPSRSKGRAWRG